MLHPLAIVPLLMTLLMLPERAASSCGTLSSTPDSTGYAPVCTNILAYSNVYIITPSVNCTAADDNAMSLVTMYASSLSRPCADAVLRYTCGYFHRPCSAPLGPPQSICDKLNATNVANVCNQLDYGVLQVLQGGLQANGVPSFNFRSCSSPSYTTYKTPANASSPLFSDAEMGLPGCVDYTGGTVCDGVVNYKVYATQRAYGSTQLGQASQLVNGFSFLNNLVPKKCLTNYHKLLCYSAFPRCHNLLTDLAQTNPLALAGRTAPFPEMPSTTLCNNVMSECGNNPSGTPWVAPWFQKLGLTPNFCSSTKVRSRTCSGNISATATTLPLFYPSSGLPIVTGGSPVLANDPNNTVAITAYFKCPDPLVVPHDPNAETVSGGSCAVPCPTFMFPIEHWHNLDKIFLICGSLSVVLASFLMVKFVFYNHEKKRKWPLTLLVCNTWFVSVVMLVPIIASSDLHGHGRTAGVVCKDNSQIRDDAGSKALGVLNYLSVMSLAWCALSMNIDLFKAVYAATRKKLVDIVDKGMMGFSGLFGLFVFAVIIYGIVEDKFGPSTFNEPVASFNSEQPIGHTTDFFIGPFVAVTCCSLIAMAAVVYQVWHSTRAVSNVPGQRKGGMSFFSLHGRTMGIILVILAETITVGCYFLSEKVKGDQYIADATAYVQCLLVDRPTSVLQASVDPQVPIVECHLSPRDQIVSEIVYSVIMLYGFAISLVYIIPCHSGEWKRLQGKLLPCLFADESSTASKVGSSGSEASKLPIDLKNKIQVGSLGSTRLAKSTPSGRLSPRPSGGSFKLTANALSSAGNKLSPRAASGQAQGMGEKSEEVCPSTAPESASSQLRPQDGEFSAVLMHPSISGHLPQTMISNPDSNPDPNGPSVIFTIDEHTDTQAAPVNPELVVTVVPLDLPAAPVPEALHIRRVGNTHVEGQSQTQ